MKPTLWRGLCFSALALLFAIPANAGELKLSINAGRVTVIATNVPVSQVLQEWARVGHTKIVNAERIMGPPVTVQLVNVPEKEALDIILRSASGYVAAPRPELVADASMYDRIMVMPTSIAPPEQAAPVTAAPQPFRAAMPSPVDDDDDEPVNIPPPMIQPPPQTGPFGRLPSQQRQPAAEQAVTPGPFLSATPGVVVGAPNGQQNPNQPPPVVKPGGGGGA